MRCAILSDIHGNLDALNAVIEQFEGIDAVYCPGDIVGYGAQPNECCDIIRERAAGAAMGNHDATAAGIIDASWFSHHARAAIEWTASTLSKENLSYLASLPMVYKAQDFLMFHATLNRPEIFEYISSTRTAWNSTFSGMMDCSLAFFGHTHIAEYYTHKAGDKGVDKFSMAEGGVIEIRPGFRYIINCGSVGQPRDRNPAASFGIYDTEAGEVEILRVTYDISAARKKILAAGLPRILADRLVLGI